MRNKMIRRIEQLTILWWAIASVLFVLHNQLDEGILPRLEREVEQLPRSSSRTGDSGRTC
jgi:hypothetical protein